MTFPNLHLQDACADQHRPIRINAILSFGYSLLRARASPCCLSQTYPSFPRQQSDLAGFTDFCFPFRGIDAAASLKQEHQERVKT
jgi:hypothetical protein